MILAAPIFLGLVLVIAGVSLHLAERRLGIARTLVRQMAMVTAQNLPLGTGLMLAGRSEGGKAGKVLRRVAELIAGGSPPSQAVSQGFPASSGYMRSVIHAGELAGRLPAVLKMLHADLDNRAQQRMKMMPMAIVYALTLLFALMVVGSALGVVILPKFKQICVDFAAPFPRPTLRVIEAFDWVNANLAEIVLWGVGIAVAVGLYGGYRSRASGQPPLFSRIADPIRRASVQDVAAVILFLVLFGLAWIGIGTFISEFTDFGREFRYPDEVVVYWPLLILASAPTETLAVLALLVGVPIGVHRALRPRRFDRPYLASEISDRLRWSLPGLGKMEMADGLATVAYLLRLFVGAGMRLEQAADLAAETDLNIVLRGRVRRFARLLESGTPPAAAAQQARLGAVMTTALRAGQYGNRLDPSLRFVAEYYRAIVSRVWVVLQTIAWPVVTLCMAVVIGFFVVALYMASWALLGTLMESM